MHDTASMEEYLRRGYDIFAVLALKYIQELSAAGEVFVADVRATSLMLSGVEICAGDKGEWSVYARFRSIENMHEDRSVFLGRYDEPLFGVSATPPEQAALTMLENLAYSVRVVYPANHAAVTFKEVKTC